MQKCRRRQFGVSVQLVKVAVTGHPLRLVQLQTNLMSSLVVRGVKRQVGVLVLDMLHVLLVLQDKGLKGIVIFGKKAA
jgi:hypothetical protein